MRPLEFAELDDDYAGYGEELERLTSALAASEAQVKQLQERIEHADRLLFAAWQESTHPSTANPAFIDKCVREARCTLGGTTEEKSVAEVMEQGETP